MTNLYDLIKADIKSTIAMLMEHSLIYNPTFSDRCCKQYSISSKLEGPKIQKDKTYVENFLKFYNNNEYLFLFKDHSFIQVKYDFIKSEKDRQIYVNKANLNFYPNPGLYDADILEALKADKLSEEEQLDLWGQLRIDLEQDFAYHSNYMRLDYSASPTDFTELTHPRCHIHIGLNNDFRLAANKLPYLSDFVDLVLFSNYNKDWQTLHQEKMQDLTSYLRYRKQKQQSYTQLTEFEDVLTEVEMNSYLLKLI
ncbi:hypothetical protein ABE61_18765 [Lysinibacillus sphaericus]|uniref:DUF2290 domain-containing protein n=1 Tax=Lysinibacillus sphaericus TaxID=1421 RepID=UPI0018CDDBF3|nr:DUF2290 domain-containing protein [Lysinibacillus sphaericus]MBG9456029.1 hypothetical protein [Lysinibacillus sphaericus]MBG9479316.1 hypothetical protein [Lysinibacillus sphaericus]MBG9593429.1 hypothetical protein [Lysinibacillus sphaericus]